MTRRALITGGAGYLGSHACVRFIEAGYEVFSLDNFRNSNQEALCRIEAITGRKVINFEGDVRDVFAVDSAFRACRPDVVVHFAGLKSVFESVESPGIYYDINGVGTLRVASAAIQHNCRSCIFSSSATVYGQPDALPVDESAAVRPENPYGRSKAVAENILRDLSSAHSGFGVCILRYFNPVGAHSSGLIGEDPKGIPANLLPFVAQVAVGQYKCVSVFGSDWPTHDGTGIRDYIHVEDLIDAHLAAAEYIAEHKGVTVVNVGTGRGLSVLEIIGEFEKVLGKNIPTVRVDRRPGDVAEVVADPSLAEALLGWKAKRGVSEMCADHLRWQLNISNKCHANKP